MAHKILVATGGGDCPGLNAVIRGIVKRAAQEGEDWQVFGCIESFNGILKDNVEIVPLTESTVSGIHVKGGTIIKTTNKGGPFHFPVRQPDGNWKMEDRSQLMKKRFQNIGFDAIINIGGDGSQRISLDLLKLGIPVLGVRKTFENDLSSTVFTIGFLPAVQIAWVDVDKLVTT
ncbi:MAG: 6-phosphofructokinase, partial [Bacteroidales bacterium]|nr:6-phosphofructokinase [Bacteroidales bacterium]